MIIGIVTTWFDRGAAYVSKAYKQALEAEGHIVYIYARGGEDHPSRDFPQWNSTDVTRDDFFVNTRIREKKLFRWIKKNDIETIFFNEQQDYRIVVKTKMNFPSIKIGAYVDYYTENTIPWFRVYDFVLCNTQRHMQAMKDHPQKIYIRWGADINTYLPSQIERDKITFFHSVGMSNRKGTDILVNAYIKGKLYKRSRLIIHTQIPIENVCKYNEKELKKFGIEIIEKTVSAPGLYHLGDIYVYPTRLDGLGLTMYEALSCGLPCIVTNFPPMNEIISGQVGKLVKIKDFQCRSDAYYYPLAECDEDDLISCMSWYIENPDQINVQKQEARNFAIKDLDISNKSSDISRAFLDSKIRNIDYQLCQTIIDYYRISENIIFRKILGVRKFRRILKRIKKNRKQSSQIAY